MLTASLVKQKTKNWKQSSSPDKMLSGRKTLSKISLRVHHIFGRPIYGRKVPCVQQFPVYRI
jgi:hypothetical protein